MIKLLYKKGITMYSMKNILIGSMVLSLLPGCFGSGIKGSGVAASKEVACSNVNKVKISGVGKLIITQSKDQNESLKIDADDNILPLIVSNVSHNELEIKIQDDKKVNPSVPLVYNLTVKDITKVDVSGTMVVELSNVQANALDIVTFGNVNVTGKVDVEKIQMTSAGISNFVLSGRADFQKFTSKGSCSFDGTNLKGKEAHLEMSGAGTVTLNVSDAINGSVSGASEVSYLNNPVVKATASGISSISKAKA